MDTGYWMTTLINSQMLFSPFGFDTPNKTPDCRFWKSWNCYVLYGLIGWLLVVGNQTEILEKDNYMHLMNEPFPLCFTTDSVVYVISHLNPRTAAQHPKCCLQPKGLPAFSS